MLRYSARMDARVTGPRDRVDIAARRAEIAARRRQRRKLDPRWAVVPLVLLALIAGFAIASGQLRWGAVVDIPAGGDGVVLARMPYERPGWNFPGSAFYYLAPDDEVGDVPLAAGMADTPIELVVATAFSRAGSASDQQRALTCLAEAVWYEARSEPDSGQRAVAQVVLNRVKHPSWPGSVCGVVYQGSSRSTGCQFSFTCDGSLGRKPAGRTWTGAIAVARAALGGYVHRQAGLATHYHTLAVDPYWAPKLAALTVIGAHRFYALPGRGGTRAGFTSRYSGSEPTTAAVRAADVAAPDPVAALPDQPVAAQTDRLPPAPRAVGEPATPAPSPAPAPSGTPTNRLPGGGTVRDEYKDSGKWRDRPGTAPEREKD